MKQLSLFGQEAKPKTQVEPEWQPKPHTPSPKPLVQKDTCPYKTEELIQHIESEMYLWDMRCWDERSREQAERWVANIKAGNRDHKNCGHAHYCIENLLKRNIEEKIIVDAIMRNNQVQYAHRLVKCFGGFFEDGEHPCPKARAQGGYGNGICDECEGSHPSTRPKKCTG